jgi:hypothetical protein
MNHSDEPEFQPVPDELPAADGSLESFEHFSFHEVDPRICHADDPDRQDVVNAYREAGRDFIAFYDQVLAFVMTYESPILAAWVVAVASGRHLLTGGISQVELAERLGVTRATVSKAVKTFQASFGNDIAGIEPMPGQRTLASCKKFAETRNHQLK